MPAARGGAGVTGAAAQDGEGGTKTCRGAAAAGAAGEGVESLREDRPAEPSDIVDQPGPGPGRIDGGYPGRVLHRSPLTLLLGVPRRPVELLTAAVGRLHRGPH